MFRMRFVLLLAAAAAACDVKSPAAPGLGSGAALRVIVAAHGVSTVEVLVDRQMVATGLGFGATSDLVSLAPGAHHLLVRPAGSATVAGERWVLVDAGDTATAIAVDSSTVINPYVITDTGKVPAPGHTKLQVVHFAAGAPAIDVWRTQPDYDTLIRVMFPFAYRAASGYLQSTVGTWTIVVSHATTDSIPHAPPDTLLATGDIPIAADEAWTVVLLDGDSTGMQYRLVRDHH